MKMQPLCVQWSQFSAESSITFSFSLTALPDQGHVGFGGYPRKHSVGGESTPWMGHQSITVCLFTHQLIIERQENFSIQLELAPVLNPPSIQNPMPSLSVQILRRLLFLQRATTVISSLQLAQSCLWPPFSRQTC